MDHLLANNSCLLLAGQAAPFFFFFLGEVLMFLTVYDHTYQQIFQINAETSLQSFIQWRLLLLIVS